MPDEKPTPPQGVLGSLNNSLTAFSAVVTTLGALAAGIAALMSNFAKQEATSAKTEATEAKNAVQNFELKDKNVQASYDFARFFLENLKQSNSDAADGKGTDEDKQAVRRSRVRGLLVSLDIVAKASVADQGDTPEATRATLPIQLALMEGDAGAVAALDDNLDYVEKWIGYAELDQNDAPRMTAIRALEKVCKRAARDGNLKTLFRGAKAIYGLSELVDSGQRPEGDGPLTGGDDADTQPVTAVGQKPVEDVKRTALVLVGNVFNYAMAPAQQKRLSGYSSTDEQKWWKEFLRIGTDAAEELTKLLDARSGRLVLTANKVQNAGVFIESNDAVPLPAMSVAPQVDEAPMQTTALLVQTKELANIITEAKRVLAVKDSPVTVNSPPPEAANELKYQRLLQNLESDAEKVRRDARQDLALFGQAKASALVSFVNANLGRFDLEYRRRLGGITALSKMRPPPTLDANDAKAVAGFIVAPDSDTRLASVDFLINLEDIPTLDLVFEELKTAVDNAITKNTPTVDGTRAVNAATVVAGWLTAFPPSARSAPPVKAFVDKCGTTAKGWLARLKDEGKEAGWKQLKGRVEYMLAQLAKRK